MSIEVLNALYTVFYFTLNYLRIALGRAVDLNLQVYLFGR